LRCQNNCKCRKSSTLPPLYMYSLAKRKPPLKVPPQETSRRLKTEIFPHVNYIIS
jgi:hypothetical protein